MEMCAKHTPRGCTAADFYFCSTSGIRSKIQIKFSLLRRLQFLCFELFSAHLNLFVPSPMVTPARRRTNRIMFQNKLSSSCRSCIALCNYSPIWVLLPNLFDNFSALLYCVSLSEPFKRTWIVFLLFPRASSLTNLFLKRLPSWRWNWKFLLLWKISIKDKSSTVTSITDRRSKKKHRNSPIVVKTVNEYKKARAKFQS